MAYEYEVKGQKVILEEDKDLMAVRYKEPAPLSLRATVAADMGLGPFQARIEIPNENYTIFQVPQTAQPRAARHAAALETLNRTEEVVRAAPVFRLGELRVLATDRVLVGFKPGTNGQAEILEAYGGRIIEKMADEEYLVRLPEDVDPLKVASELASREEVDYAEPDFVTIGKRIALRPPRPGSAASDGDPLSEEQYAIRITQAEQAWYLQIGSPSIKIAILDEGVDTAHEDLADAIVGGYDGVDDDTFQEPNSWDGHGTACAGLAAAIHNNKRGIRGIGGGCSLLAVRIAYSPSESANYWITETSWITRAIDWSWQNGADVLSNSWGGGAPSSAIINAYERARTQGRGGKGCVLVAAAGNESGPVIFPATLETVVAVSASNEYDEFKTTMSRDGEWWWGSNFGPEVDIAAPGVHNRTTDITGWGGYAVDSDYTDFNGTSSATPIVAGAAGLLLSANPDLTEAEVRAVLLDTADKVGSLPYTNGRNDQMGYGRLNVLRALQQVTGEATPLAGTIRQIGSGQPKAGAFYLETEDGGTYLLRAYQGSEAAVWPILEEQSLTYLAPFSGQQVTVAYTRRQDTAHGTILWGVSIS